MARLIAALLVVLATAVALAIVFVPSQLQGVHDELAWRERTGPMAYLEAHPWGVHRHPALAELDAEQRAQGLVARLLPPLSHRGRLHSGLQLLSAAWSADARELHTGTATQLLRWNAQTGELLRALGPTNRRSMDDSRQWGFGLVEVVRLGDGRAVALAADPPTLWVFEGEVLASRRVLPTSRPEGLTARDTRLAWREGLERGQVIEAPTGAPVALPHEEITAIALLEGGGVLTGSRRELRRWGPGGVALATLPIEASANPVAFSSDGRWALAPAHQRLERWSTQDGRPAHLEPPPAGAPASADETELTAACASADYVAVGTAGGEVLLWRADGQPLRRFRSSSTRIDLLACADDRLLAIGDHRRDARVWDVAGRPQAAVVAPALPVVEVNWLVREAADRQLPRHHPAWMAWAEWLDDDAFRFGAIGAWLLLVLAVRWVWRWL